MKKRIIFGLVMIAVLLGVFWADWKWENSYRTAHPDANYSPTAGVPLAVIFLPILWIGFLEFAKMAGGVGVKVHTKAGLAGVTLLSCLPVIRNALLEIVSRIMQPNADADIDIAIQCIKISNIITWPLAIAFAVMLIFLAQMIKGRLEDALRRVACTTMGVMYLGLFGGILLLFRIRYGMEFLLMFIAAVKCTDIGAYFTGSFIGKHKMIPWLSPGKTWEGLAGGLITGALVAVLIWRIFGSNLQVNPFDNMIEVAIFGIIVGAAGQFGDLCESLMKRSAGVKDSGALVPEFGGVLDILDSPLLAGPIAYVLFTIFALI